MLESQKLLLTWIIEEEGLYPQLKPYISPKDFTDELYREAATILFSMFDVGKVNPAIIINQFENEDDQREIAGNGRVQG